MDHPTLTCSILTFKRPWYALITLYAVLENLSYAGHIKYLIGDGGSPEWQLQMYRDVLTGRDYEILVESSGSVSNLMNAVVEKSGDVWVMMLDDFYPQVKMSLTLDVGFLLNSPDVGHLRYAALNHWDVSKHRLKAELRGYLNFHYWVLDKSGCQFHTMWPMGFSMMHRRMWDAYGPIGYIPPHQPGEVENLMNNQFRERSGPTVAIPMRLWEESDMSISLRQPIAHVGHVRTDEYANLWHQRWGAV